MSLAEDVSMSERHVTGYVKGQGCSANEHAAAPAGLLALYKHIKQVQVTEVVLQKSTL